MISEDKVVKLLGRGIANREVAMTLGCTEGYISQLLARDDIAARVQEARATVLADAIDRDEKYERIEDKLLTKLEETSDLLFRPEQIASILLKINATTRRSAGLEPASTVVNNTIVQLTLPIAAMNRYSLNGNGEVTDVEDQPLVTMSARQLIQQLQSQGAQNHVGSKGEPAIVSP